jgi:hypothetical protein
MIAPSPILNAGQDHRFIAYPHVIAMTVSPLLSHADVICAFSKPHSSKKIENGYVESDRKRMVALVKMNLAPQAMEQNMPIISLSLLMG